MLFGSGLPKHMGYFCLPHIPTAACIKYLLVAKNFYFVLTRKFSIDPFESLFGTLRRSLGCNDQLDVRPAVAGLEKLLKTGIALAPENSNVLHHEGRDHSATITHD